MAHVVAPVSEAPVSVTVAMAWAATGGKPAVAATVTGACEDYVVHLSCPKADGLLLEQVFGSDDDGVAEFGSGE